MRLDEILTRVERSASSHWTRINAHTLSDWDWGEENGKAHLRPILHSELYVFCLDADITIAFGAPVKDPFRADWTDRFPDHDAYTVAADLRYRGTTVTRWTFGVLDGGRYTVPLPAIGQDGNLFITDSMMAIGRLVFKLRGPGGVTDSLIGVLERAGFRF